jgi:hypothetical protein
MMRDIISEEKMFGNKNPSVIVCSKEIGTTIDLRALHITDRVLRQMDKVGDEDGQTVHVGQAVPHQVWGGQCVPLVNRTVSIATTVQTNRLAKVQLAPLFLAVIRRVQGADRSQTVFTNEEVTRPLSMYIKSKNDVVFDPRNTRLALVTNYPLGAAFGVNAFHRCQVNCLLRSQLHSCTLDTESRKEEKAERGATRRSDASPSTKLRDKGG